MRNKAPNNSNIFLTPPPKETERTVNGTSSEPLMYVQFTSCVQTQPPEVFCKKRCF